MVSLEPLFHEFNAREWERFDDQVAALFTEEFVLHLPRHERPLLGRDAYVLAVRNEVDLYPDLRYEIGVRLDGPATTALTLIRRFTRRRRPMAVPVCLIAELSGNRVRSIFEYAAAPRREGASDAAEALFSGPEG